MHFSMHFEYLEECSITLTPSLPPILHSRFCFFFKTAAIHQGGYPFHFESAIDQGINTFEFAASRYHSFLFRLPPVNRRLTQTSSITFMKEYRGKVAALRRVPKPRCHPRRFDKQRMHERFFFFFL